MLHNVTQGFFRFFPDRMKREIRELYVSTTILNFALAMILIFEPIYLYTIGYSLKEIILFFLLVYLIYLFLLPLGAKFAKRVGYEHSIAVSTIVFILYYLVFYNIAAVDWFFYLAAFLYAAQKTLYWPAYHADFARFADVGQDGREISLLTVIVSIVSIAAPLISGIVLENWGFAALFTFVSIIFLISNVPLLVTKEVFEPSPFPYFDTFKALLAPERRRQFLSYLGFGEELVVLVVWPVFIATIITDLLNIGILTALATFVSLVVTMYIGRTSDSGNKRRILRFGTIVYAFAWLIRLLVKGASGIFLTDSLSRISKNIVSVPLTAIMYEQAKQKSVMHTVMFFETSLVVGKLVALIVIYLMLTFLTGLVPETALYQITFVLAGFMTMLYMLR